jgi:hypothetical protein
MVSYSGGLFDMGNGLNGNPLMFYVREEKEMTKLLRGMRTAAVFLVAGVTWEAGIGVRTNDGAEPSPQTTEVLGIDVGGKGMALFVARDKATWDAVKKAVGRRQMLPIGFAQGGGLDRLDTVEFQKDMIVAVFWGQMSFAGEGEKCWIESVTHGKDEVTVDCRANLWGGAVDHAYRAWPYHAKVVARSDLPVTFMQTTEYKARPALSKKDQKLATLKPNEWQWKTAAGQ